MLILVLSLFSGASAQVLERVIPKASWGGHAVAPGVAEQYKPNTRIRYISLHHTDSSYASDRWKETELLRFIQEYHQNKGFRDIGYHYLVGDSGAIYKGRADDRAPASFTHYLSEAELKGAKFTEGRVAPASPPAEDKPGHTEGHLTVSLICGKDKGGKALDAPLSDTAMANTAKLIAELLVRHGLTPADIRAHREVAGTGCPGDAIYQWLRGRDADPKGEGPGMRLIRAELAKLQNQSRNPSR